MGWLNLQGEEEARGDADNLDSRQQLDGSRQQLNGRWCLHRRLFTPPTCTSCLTNMQICKPTAKSHSVSFLSHAFASLLLLFLAVQQLVRQLRACSTSTSPHHRVLVNILCFVLWYFFIDALFF